ncbi:hypothetical protein ACP70R_039129 [Stipagrostis hirtigluma subsp. patula]
MLGYNGEDPRVATTQGKYWGIFIYWLLGNGCLFAFNSVLTILDYYMYLFLNYHPARVITLIYQSVVTTTIFTYYEAKLNTRLRNLLDVATSGRGGTAPFVGICIVAAAFGVADGHVQGGMTGDLSLMCPSFIQSFYAGIGASGTIASALRFIAKAAFENSQDGLREGAIVFFSISLPIVKFYRSKSASEGSLTVTADLAAGGIQTRPNPLWYAILAQEREKVQRWWERRRAPSRKQEQERAECV